MEYIGVIWPIDPNFQRNIQVGLPKPILKLNNLKVVFFCDWVNLTDDPPLLNVVSPSSRPYVSGLFRMDHPWNPQAFLVWKLRK